MSRREHVLTRHRLACRTRAAGQPHPALRRHHVRLCEHLQLAPGARCLELGAGTGTVAEALAERVCARAARSSPSDTDTRFLEPLGSEVLRVEAADVTAGLPSGRVRSRPCPAAARARAAAHGRAAIDGGVRPYRAAGCWSRTSTGRRRSWSIRRRPLLSRIAGACRGFMSSHGYDPEFGRRLPRALAASRAGRHRHARAGHAGATPTRSAGCRSGSCSSRNSALRCWPEGWWSRLSWTRSASFATTAPPSSSRPSW